MGIVTVHHDSLGLVYIISIVTFVFVLLLKEFNVKACDRFLFN